ncbi:winged helix DNA-binding protein [Larkinella arboricola]|uniref:Winged helix DNA-binding protein n=1 Tax=Larkinella arboricola TaxID=643671 RepID=A0A327X6Q9_LARAB|nr:winged helix DNA-binding domain-containing protein [Larkinella arboricola]RAK02359.1 winged helix DNA-binding protein [Larkinella arboricola]
MTLSDITRYRLYNQQLTQTGFQTPAEVVSWFGAVQAQDHPASKWALGNRLPGSTDADMEQALTNRTIIRTWPMRGTLHFVAAADIHWLLNLIHPRSKATYANHLRRLELNETIIAKSHEVITKALEGGKQLKRSELKLAMEQAGIPTHDNRLGILWGQASFDRLICHGTRCGSEFTFVLLDEWVPRTKSLTRDEALAELTRRYFTSHGPATLADFSWWSSLTLTEARAGIELIKADFMSKTVEGQTYWMPSSLPDLSPAETTAFLLPVYDEYLVAYKDRSAPLDGLDLAQVAKAGNGIFSPVIVVDGRVVGTWNRKLQKNELQLETHLFTSLSDAQQQALYNATERYRRFLRVA